MILALLLAAAVSSGTANMFDVECVGPRTVYKGESIKSAPFKNRLSIDLYRKVWADHTSGQMGRVINTLPDGILVLAFLENPQEKLSTYLSKNKYSRHIYGNIGTKNEIFISYDLNCKRLDFTGI
jgi:hypothetical protein